MSWIWSLYFICLFFSLAAKLIGARTGRQFFKNVDFLDLHPLKVKEIEEGKEGENGKVKEYKEWD